MTTGSSRAAATPTTNIMSQSTLPSLIMMMLTKRNHYCLLVLWCLTWSLPLLLQGCNGQPSTVPSLTTNNYDELTHSKTVFIKFFAPWCAYCKRMAGDWQRLSDEWKDHKVGLVAQVDCTDYKDGGKALCQQVGIQSFPTFKYGHPQELEDYEGGRTYDDLAAFAKENLVPVCSADRMDLCDEQRQAEIQGYLDLSVEELERLIEAEEAKLKEAEEQFSQTVEDLSRQYGDAEKERDAVIAKVTRGDLGLMRSVRLAKSALEEQLEGEADDDDEAETKEEL